MRGSPQGTAVSLSAPATSSCLHAFTAAFSEVSVSGSPDTW
jgi:hypothetical protein